jgi:hypothetical protein
VKRIFIIALLLIPPLPAQAARDSCTRAARIAAERSGVPADILLAITMVETGYDGAPWPWTLNHAGRGHWFPDGASAQGAAERILAEGGMVDVGCFQINTHWHGAAFSSLDQMLDPLENALYAAGYLSRLRAETGDWSAAISAYHSRDPDRGSAYLDRVNARLGRVAEDDPPPARRNRFPLLNPGDPASAGTIVPRLAGIAPLVGGP